MNHQDIVIEAFDAKVGPVAATPAGEVPWQRSFKVRVVQSPAGEMAIADAATCACDERALQQLLRELDKRAISRDRLIELGRLLGMLLLPTSTIAGGSGVRELFSRSLDIVGRNGGLRLRLMLPSLLGAMPWEYTYLDRTGSAVGNMLGFLALDPRISIVRHEALPLRPLEPAAAGDINVLAVLASPPNQEPLDLTLENKVLEQALQGASGIKLDVRNKATLQTLSDGLADKQVLHFAGHGLFEQRPGPNPGSTTGVGMIALEDRTLDAEELGIVLRGNDIRLAVLGGCETGRLAGAHGWEGVASALMRAEIPAVVANQFAILDTSAIAFTRGLYQALAGGLPIDSAVQAGRLAAYNADTANRDWGVPVLYLRAKDGALFAGAKDPDARSKARESAEINVKQRVGEIAAGGVLVGARLREVISKNVHVDMEVTETVLGKATGVRADAASGGSIEVKQDIKSIGPGGSAVGVDFGTSASRRTTRGAKAVEPRPQPAAAEPTMTRRPAPAVASTQEIHEMNGGEAIGVQYRGIDANNVQISNTTINQYAAGAAERPEPGRAARLVEEEVRLDVAVPKAATVGEAFNVVAQVKQPKSPPLSVPEIDQHYASAPGVTYRPEDSDSVQYRIEVAGVGFEVVPASLRIRLRPGRDSLPIAFQVTALKPGRRSLLVYAYQEDNTLAAQTGILVEVSVAVQPPGPRSGAP